MFKHSLWKNVCHVVGQEWELVPCSPFLIVFCIILVPDTTEVYPKQQLCRYTGTDGIS